MGLGDTVVDPEKTDFSMPSQVEMLDDFLDRLGIERVHLVAHDQGGAAAQIFATRRTARLDRLVLTDCVAYDNWPVPAIRQLMTFARVPIVADLASRFGLVQALETHTKLSRFRRGVVDPSALSEETIAEYLRPLRGTHDERERFLRFLLAGSARHTQAVVPLLRELRRPTLVLWAENDRYIATHWGRRLYHDIPGAVRFEILEGAGHFWQEERPVEFAARIREFLLDPAHEPRETTARPTKDESIVEPERLARTKKQCAVAKNVITKRRSNDA